MANGEQLGYITKKTNANVNLIFLFFFESGILRIGLSS